MKKLNITNNLKKISELKKIEIEAISLVKKIRRNIATAILAAFAFVIALVWRDAIQEIVNNVVSKFNIPQRHYLFQIIAAVFVTAVCVFGIIIFSRWAEKKG